MAFVSLSKSTQPTWRRLDHTESELEEIREALQSIKTLVARLDESFHKDDFLNKMAKEDIRFHMAIMSAAKNGLIKSEILRLHIIDRVVSGIAPIYMENRSALEDERQSAIRTVKEHTDILTAIERRNAAAAKAAMQVHIQDVIDHAIQRMGVKETSQVSSELGY